MWQKSSILYMIDYEAVKVQANAHHHNFFPGQDIRLKSS